MNLNLDPSLDILRNGKFSLEGEFTWGSNYTFLVNIDHAGQTIQGVYKPTRGERPLWDFPTATLARREVAAYLVSEALGWRLVPPTVYRQSGPLGRGSLQLFIEHDPEYHYFNFEESDRQRLRSTVIFDILINNADRKGSHILKAKDDHLWLIDHGVCFHVEDKLRTVIWDFVGEPMPENLCQDLTRLAQLLDPDLESPESLATTLQQHLARGEVAALRERALKLVEEGTFPAPDPYRRPFPWPQL